MENGKWKRLATCWTNTETMLVMTINDPLIHPALLDPRQWAEVDLYGATANIDREAISGAEHHTPDRKVEIKHLKLDLRFDNERRYLEASATFTLSPINDGLTSFELDIAEMEIESATLTYVDERGADSPQKSPDQAAGILPRRLEFATRPEKLEIE